MLTSSLTNFFVKDESKTQINLAKLYKEIENQRQLIESQDKKLEELNQMVKELLKKC